MLWCPYVDKYQSMLVGTHMGKYQPTYTKHLCCYVNTYVCKVPTYSKYLPNIYISWYIPTYVGM
jgi:hypothetical protein